jgi:hypothetical protein
MENLSIKIHRGIAVKMSVWNGVDMKAKWFSIWRVMCVLYWFWYKLPTITKKFIILAKHIENYILVIVRGNLFLTKIHEC